MRILSLAIAIFLLMFGVRMVVTALRTALSGKILVRQGAQFKWQPASTMNDAWKIAFREGLMGILLIVLGVALMT
jgi:hypothetical protein